MFILKIKQLVRFCNAYASGDVSMRRQGECVSRVRWQTIWGLGAQPLIFAMVDAEWFRARIVLGLTSVLYIALSIESFCVDMPRHEVAHHMFWGAALAALPWISSDLQLSLICRMVVANNVCIAGVILAHRLRCACRLALLSMGMLRLVAFPVVWLSSFEIWYAWHHAMHATAWLYALADALRRVRVASGTMRDAIFTATGVIQRIPVHVLSIAEMRTGFAEKILKRSAEKGVFLEKLHALPTWSPIISIESVDGAQWKRMLRAVHVISASVDAVGRAAGVAARTCERRAAEDSVQRVIASVAHEILFGDMASSKEIQLWCDAATTLSLSLSVKSAGADRTIVRDAIATCLLRCQACRWWRDVRDGCESDEEAVSCALQPFLVSPIINLMDALAACARVRPANTPADVVRAIATWPPFPVLERWDAALGVHAVVNSDEYAATCRADDSAPPAWLAFGAGPRACPGKSIAISIVRELYFGWIATIDDDAAAALFAVHVASGRLNDARGAPAYTQCAVILKIWKRAFSRKIASVKWNSHAATVSTAFARM